MNSILKKLNLIKYSVGNFGSISTDEKVNFARHLSIVIKAGLPLIDGLRIIRKQAGNGTFGKIIDYLIESVNSGQSLTHGLKHYSRIFENFFISIVQVGEVSGTLSQNLMYLSSELKKIKDLKNRLRSALIYPIILFIATVAISVFLTFYIFPKMIASFSQLGVKLPGTTLALIAILGFLKTYGIHLALAAVVIFITARFLLRVKSLRYALHKSFFYIPIISHLTVNMNIASASRILSILLKSGVKIVEAMNIVGDTFDNLVYKKAFQDAAEAVKRGTSIAEFMSGQNRIFPPIFSAMVDVGESTGNLEENLLYLSDYYTEEVDGSLKNLTSVMEPLLILFMGMIVGFVALSIVTPMYSISQGLSK